MPDARTTIIITARDETKAAIRSAQASLTGLNTQLQGLGETGRNLVGALAFVGIARGITQFAREAISAAAALNDVALQTGLSVEQFGGLKFAAEQSGSNVRALERALGKLQGKLGEAGISGERAHGIFLALADRVKATIDPAKQATLVYSVFGERLGRQLLPLFKQGAEGIRDLEEAAKGIILTDEAAKAADAFEDALKKLSGAAQAGFVEALIPTLEELTQLFNDPATLKSVHAFGESIADVFKFIAEHADAIKNLGIVLAGAFSVRLLTPFVAGLVGVAGAIGSAVTSTLTLGAAARVAAQATVAEAAAVNALTQFRLREAQAAVVAAAGTTRIAIVTAELIPLQAAAAASTAALTGAQVALGAATAVGSRLAIAARAALALLGGPIGIITTLLVAGASAWFLWGDSSEDAVDKAEDSLDRATKAIKDFDDQELVGKAGTTLVLNLRELQAELKKLQDNLDVQIRDEGSGFEKSLARITQLKAKIAELSSRVPAKAGGTGADEAGLKKLLEKTVKGGDIAKAQTAVTLGLIKAQTATSLKELENLYSDHLITISAYYAARLKLETDAIDAEIAVAQKAAQAATGAERVRLEGQIAELKEKRSAAAIESTHAEAAAQKKLNDEFEKTRATLAELQGKVVLAAEIKIDLDQREERQKAQTALDAEGPLELKVKPTLELQNLDEIRRLTIAGAGLSDLERQLTDINTAAGESEKTLQLNIESGLETQLSAGEKTIDLHQRTADALEALLPAYRAVNEAIGTPEALNRIKAVENRILELRIPINLLGAEIKGAVTSSFSTFFSDLITGAQTVGEAFEALTTSLLNAFADIAAQHLAEELFASAKGALTPAAETGVSAAASAVSGAADVAGQAAASAALTTAGATLSAAAVPLTTAGSGLSAVVVPLGAAGEGLTGAAGILAAAGEALAVAASEIAFSAGASAGVGLVAHSGGIVGSIGTTRMVSPWVFAGAPRLHRGGMLASDEVPAILQTGEGVLSRADMRGLRTRGGDTYITNMNVTTPDAQSFRKARSQIEADMRLAAERGRRNL